MSDSNTVIVSAIPTIPNSTLYIDPQNVEAIALLPGDIISLPYLGRPQGKPVIAAVDHVDKIDKSTAVKIYFVDGASHLTPKSSRVDVIGRIVNYKVQERISRVIKITTDDNEDVHVFGAMKSAMEFIQARLESGIAVCASADVVAGDGKE